jgi:APA family basic amino acid/polyamine antiporter
MASAPTATTTAAPPPTGGFVRKASGLVRDFSQLDAWIYNVLAINIVLNVALSYVLVTVTYPRASLWLSLVVAGVLCTFEAVVYAFFTTAMPRSGGDYVFQSRVLGGGVATIFAFTAVTISQMIWMALAGWFGANLIFSPFLLLLGAQYDVGWLKDVGEWFPSHLGILLTGIACTAWSAFINIKGLRLYALLQRYLFWAGMVCLVIVVGALLFSSHSSFVSNFNDFMSKNYGVNDAYATTIKNGGTADFSFSFGDTILASVIASFALIYPAWGVMQAGEIKRANSLQSNVRAIVGAEVFSFVAVAIMAALLVSRVGKEFLYASGSLFYGGGNGDNPLPVPPFFGFFVALVSSSPILIWVSFALFLAWFVMWFPNITLGGTRVMIAMAFDRILPEAIGQVNRRTHTPIVAIAVFSVGCLIATVLYAYWTKFVEITLGLLILNITGFAATMAAAVVFPYTKKAMFESTVASRYRIAGVPWMSVAAIVFLGFVVFVDVQALRADELGLNGTSGLIFIFGCYAISAIIYITSKLYRRRKDGLDLALVYRELPAE